jgi:6-phospho-3-hexuloisomerase
MIDPERLDECISSLATLSRPKEENGSHLFCLGSGMSSVVASMAAARFQHLGMQLQSAYDWRFRRRNDVLLVVSGSGQTTTTIDFVRSAKESGMRVIGFTSYPDSPLGWSSDIVIGVPGRENRASNYERPIAELELISPVFEYTCAVVLDSIVAELSERLSITEESMKREHANIE